MSELPKGWVGCDLASIADDISYGFTTKSLSSGSSPRLLRITDIQDHNVSWSELPRCVDLPSDRHLVKDGDIVIARTGATTGKSYLIEGVPEPTAFASYLIRLALNRNMHPQYVWKFMQSPLYWEQVQVISKGTAQPGANAAILASLQLPICSRAEQKRIVAKLDALSARSARARTDLARIDTLVTRYKQAVLSKAFSGELAGLLPQRCELLEEKCWLIPTTWRWVRFSDVIEIASNLVNPEDIQELPHIAPDNIESGSAKLLPFRTIGEDGVISSKHHFFPGQVIYSKIRPYLRKAVLVDFEGGCSADMYPLEPSERIDAHYLLHWLVSEDFTQFAIQHQGRTVLPKINQKALNQTPIPLPPLGDQQKIVRRIEGAFQKIDRLATEAKRALELVGKLDEAILAKAFRGELVPQDPKDEPASVLLARIKAERAAEPKAKRGRRARA